MSPNNGQVINIDDGNKELHGDWLLVTRKKKKPIIPALNSPKNGADKNNRFNILSNLTLKSKPGPHNPNLPPRTKQSSVARTNATGHETKRRRSEDNPHDQTPSSFVDPHLTGPTRITKPATITNTADTHMDITFNTLKASQTKNNQKHFDTNQATEPNGIIQMVTNLPPETNSNKDNILPTTTIDTNNDTTHPTLNPSDEKGNVNTEEDIHEEEDMVP